MQLSVEMIQTFEDYQRWAMERTFAGARAAGRALDGAMIPGSNGGGTVHGLLAHVVDADIHWLNRFLGNERSKLQMPGAWATLGEVESAWRADLPRRQAFFADLNEEKLRSEYGFYRGNPEQYESHVLWETILHGQNHATHHRAEVCALLTTVGFPPPDMDMFIFTRERRGMA